MRPIGAISRSQVTLVDIRTCAAIGTIPTNSSSA
jgi:hypothetical protein